MAYKSLAMGPPHIIRSANFFRPRKFPGGDPATLIAMAVHADSVNYDANIRPMRRTREMVHASGATAASDGGPTGERAGRGFATAQRQVAT